MSDPINVRLLSGFQHGATLIGLNGSLGFSLPRNIKTLLCSDRFTPLASSSDQYSERIMFDMVIDDIVAELESASSSGAFEIDIKKNNVSIFSTRLTIDATEFMSIGAAVGHGLSTTEFARGDKLTVAVIQAGNGATGLKIHLSYRYKVPSVPDVTAPNIPTGLALTVLSHTSIRVTFNASTDNIGVEGYDLQLNGGAFSNTIVNIGNVLTYDITGLSPSTLYSVQVRAYDTAEPPNYSAWSSSVTATTNAAPLLLDGRSTTFASAYGTRKVSASYSGAAIRVIDSLGAEADIGFLGDGTLNTPSLSGNAPYRVKTIYDLTGNGNTRQAEVGSEPTLDVANKSFDFAGQFFNFGDHSAKTAMEALYLMRMDNDPAASGGELNGFDEFGTGIETYVPYTNGQVYDSFGTTARKDTALDPTGDLEQWTAYGRRSSAGNWSLYINDGTTPKYTTATNTVGFKANCKVGRSSASVMMHGQMKLMIFADAVWNSTDRTNIYNDIMDLV